MLTCHTQAHAHSHMHTQCMHSPRVHTWARRTDTYRHAHTCTQARTAPRVEEALGAVERSTVLGQREVELRPGQH